MNRNYELFELAKEEIKNKNFVTAVKYLKKCLRDDSLKYYSLFEIGKIFYERRKYKISEKCFTGILKSNINDGNVIKNSKLMLLKIARITDIANIYGALCELSGDHEREFFTQEIFNILRVKFAQHFFLYEFAGSTEELFKFFKIINWISPSDCKDLLFLARIGNYLGEYEYTKKLLADNIIFKQESDGYYKNALLNELETADGETVLKSKPRALWISLSNKCNLHCFMCRTHAQKEWVLSKQDLDYIYSCFPYLEHIVWWGGEPLIYDGFKHVLSDAMKHKNIRHRIITNGQHLPDDIVDIILKNDIEVVFSVDFVDKDKYESARKGASFELLLSNIKKLSGKIKKELFKINVVSSKNNQKYNDEIIKFAKKYNFGNVNFIPIGGCGNDIKPKSDEKTETIVLEEDVIVNNAIKIFDENRKKTDNANENASAGKNVPVPGKKEKLPKFCHAPWYQLTIDYSKNVYVDPLCSNFYDLKTNLNNTKLSDAWNCEKMQEYRKFIMNIKKCHLDCPKSLNW